MKRAGYLVLLGLAAAAGAFASCAARGSEDPTEARAALRAAEDTDAAVTELEATIADFEERLEGSQGDSERFSRRLEKVSERVWRALAGLKKQLAAAHASGEAASAEAAAAEAAASAAARDLLVLENRFEYHLRQEGGR